MKKDIHPEQRPVVFVDSAAGFEFLSRSTLSSDIKRDIDGVEHDEIRLEISSASHPFFTGRQHFIDTAGRIEKFRRKYGGETKAPETKAPETKAPETKAPETKAT